MFMAAAIMVTTLDVSVLAADVIVSDAGTSAINEIRSLDDDELDRSEETESVEDTYVMVQEAEGAPGMNTERI